VCLLAGLTQSVSVDQIVCSPRTLYTTRPTPMDARNAPARKIRMELASGCIWKLFTRNAAYLPSFPCRSFCTSGRTLVWMSAGGCGALHQPAKDTHLTKGKSCQVVHRPSAQRDHQSSWTHRLVGHKCGCCLKGSNKRAIASSPCKSRLRRL
jgi:hypothetical protein